MSQPRNSGSLGKGTLLLGVDLGSVSVDTVVLDAEAGLLFADYTRTRGRPLAVAEEVLSRVFERFPREDFRACAVTGSGGSSLGALLDAVEVNEIIAAVRGVGHLHPATRTIIDVGGEDAKVILVSGGPGGGLKIDDFAMNTMCAAGTGSFLDQQAHRLGLGIEELSRAALESQIPPRLAGRCSVFAKTDMIHLQQQATPVCDIVAGLCFAVVRNLRSNIAKGKTLEPPVCLIGGVAANAGVHRALREVMGLVQGGLVVPEHFGCVAALGAALELLDRGVVRHVPRLGALREKAASREAKRLPPLRLSDAHREKGPSVAPVPAQGPLRGYLGVDVGSISTNVVVVDEAQNVLSKQYLMTAGQPLESVQEGLRRVGQEIGERLTVLGAGTTGSGRYLTADFIGADIVRNEITAQATAAAAIDPEVDTIFEIGGQDSKFISLKHGAVIDFMMNKVCAAGTGSFLEEQAEKLGISIEGEFGRRALAARRPLRMGERCTVFMESDLVSHQAAGEGIDDLVAGLCYSIVHNYLNKVVESRPVGRRVLYQGATAHNEGIVAAFEAVLGRPITVPPHNEMTGAIGAAILALRERDWQTSAFKGFEVSEAGYQISSFECRGCANTCHVRKVELAAEPRPLFYGSRCDRYDVEKSSAPRGDTPDLFEEREELLLAHARPLPPGRALESVGVPRTALFREYLPFFATFCRELGYDLELSGPTSKALIHRGVEAVVNEPCFPVKVAHGHIADLMDKGVRKILLPSLVNLDSPGHELGYGQACPYSQTLPYTVPAALDLAAAGVEIVSAPVRMGFGARRLRRDLCLLAERLGANVARVPRAMDAALEAQAAFGRRLLERGREVLARLRPDERAMVVVSRPYNGFDPGLNLGLPGKLRDLGVLAIPMDFLDLDSQLGSPELAEMYWRYGQKILAAARLVSSNPRLHALYITNFGCGPDSFILHFFGEIMAGKPFLEIEIDEHSADVGAITRLEAFLDSLRNEKPRGPASRPARRGTSRGRGRTVYLPPMTDHAQALAAAFEGCGVASEVLPESDGRTQELGRRHTSGKECYPCALVAGDLLKLLVDRKVDPARVAFFMPGGNGPCRFGQYHRYHRLVLDGLGYEEIPIFSPNQSEAFYQELRADGAGDFPRWGWRGTVAVDLLQKALHETRPYEAKPGTTDEVYRRHLAAVCDQVRRRGDLQQAMLGAREDFLGIRRNGTRRKPLVGVVGEIYTRANRFANEDVVKGIEELGGEVWMPTINEWILYNNQIMLSRARSLGWRRRWLDTRIEGWFQRWDEHQLAEVWKGVLRFCDEPSISEVLALAGPYLDPSFEGEAILSVGKSRDMYRRGAAGVVNVLPFTCMPGNIVNAVMKRVRADHGNVPFLPMAMDGQEQAGSRVRLEAFMHQVRQYEEQDGPSF